MYMGVFGAIIGPVLNFVEYLLYYGNR